MHLFMSSGLRTLVIDLCVVTCYSRVILTLIIDLCFVSCYSRVILSVPPWKCCRGSTIDVDHVQFRLCVKPTRPTVEIDGQPILTGSLDKETELYMVNVNSTTSATFPRGTLKITRE